MFSIRKYIKAKDHMNVTWVWRLVDEWEFEGIDYDNSRAEEAYQYWPLASQENAKYRFAILGDSLNRTVYTDDGRFIDHCKT